MVLVRPWPMVLLALLLAAVSSSAGAAGQETGEATESPLVTEYFVAPAADFVTNNDTNFFDQMYFQGDLGYVAGRGCAHAPALLPDGATVSSLVGYLWDNDASSVATLYLRRRSATGGGPADDMASVTTSFDTAQVIAYPDFSVSFPVIDNSSFTYFFAYCDITFPSDQRLYVARVGYTR